MGYFGTLIKKHLAMGLLLFSLICWAMTTTVLALTASNETVLIGIDKNGTRVITAQDDPLFKTEVVNFLTRFVALLYNFDANSFVDNVGSASDLMTVQLWQKEKDKTIKLGDLVKREQISHSAIVQKISKTSGKYQVLIETNQMMRMKNHKQAVKLEIELQQVERSPRNPWGMEVANLVESKVQ